MPSVNTIPTMMKRVLNIFKSNPKPTELTKRVNIMSHHDTNVNNANYTKLIKMCFGEEAPIILNDNDELCFVIQRCLAEYTFRNDETGFDALFIKYMRANIHTHIRRKDYANLNMYKQCFIVLGDHLNEEKTYLKKSLTSVEIKKNLKWFTKLC